MTVLECGCLRMSVKYDSRSFLDAVLRESLQVVVLNWSPVVDRQGTSLVVV